MTATESVTSDTALISKCENTISVENKIWPAEWGKKDTSEEMPTT